MTLSLDPSPSALGLLDSLWVAQKTIIGHILGRLYLHHAIMHPGYSRPVGGPPNPCSFLAPSIYLIAHWPVMDLKVLPHRNASGFLFLNSLNLNACIWLWPKRSVLELPSSLGHIDVLFLATCH